MPTPRHNRIRAAIGITAAVLAMLGAIGIFAYRVTQRAIEPAATPPPATSSPAGQAAAGDAPPARLSVADMMTRAGCPGAVIDTQLYSYETGRCRHPAGGEVTLAVFDTDELRDRWLEVGKGYGGTFVIGERWAAHADRADAAAQVADVLGGAPA